MLSAGLGVASLWLFLVYRTLRSARWIPVLGLVAGHAVSVKLTNVLVPALLARACLLLEGRDRYRNAVRFLFFAALPLVAQTGFAYYTRGTPFYPVGQHLPEYMQKAAAAWPCETR